MRKRLFALGALGACIFAGAITTAPAMARDGSFSCRASALRLPLLGEPVKAGDNLTTIDNSTDASDPCKPETAGVSSYGGPVGCYLVRSDPNCINPNTISVGLLYATTEECRPNTVNPADAPSPGPGDLCRSTPGAIDLQGKNAEPVLAGDGVKSRAGVADLFLTDGGAPVPNFLHVSAVNAFAEVACRPNAAGTALVPVYDARSQVVFANLQLGPLGLGLDVLPGLIPNASPTEPTLNMYGEIGPIRFNATYVNNNESGLPIGPDEGQPRKPNPTTGIVDLTGDADPSTPAFDPITKVTQRAVDVAGAIVAGEVTVDVTKNPCGPGGGDKKGKIIIHKVTDHGDQTAFGFEIDPGDLRFNLAGGQQASFDLVAGNYTVTEDANANYTQTVVCTDPSGNTTTAGRTATIALAAGETVTCTYTNTRSCPPGTVLKHGKCVVVCPDGREKPCPKPPKCDRDGDGKDDNDRDRDGKDDRDDDGDGRDDRDGKDLRSGRHDDNGDGRDDECERDRKEGKKHKCSKHSKKSKKAAKKSSGKGHDDDKGKGDKDDDNGKKKDDDNGKKKDDDNGKDKDKGDKDKKGCKSKKSKKAKKSKKR
jgi:hypothetical protein